MRFLLVILLTLVAARLLRRRPMALVMLGVVLHAAIPSVLAMSSFQLARLSVHPGSLLALWAALIVFRGHRAALVQVVRQRFELIVIAIGVALSGLVHAVLVTGGPPALSFVFDQTLIPLLSLFSVGALLVENPRSVETIRWTLAGIGVGAALLALAQSASNRVLFFESAFAEQEWYGRSDIRWMATLDHPLVLSMVLACVIPLMVSVSRWWLSIPVIASALAGIAVTESRFGIAVGVLATAYVLLRGRLSRPARSVTWLLAIAASAFVIFTGLLSGVQDRFQTANQSTDARVAAVQYFARILPGYLWSGEGTGASYTIAAAGGLESSFENSFLMMVLDVGLPTTLLYFGLFGACILVGIRRGSDEGFVVSTIVALVSVLSFSALGVRSAVALIVWVIAAVALFGHPYEDAPARRRRRTSEVPEMRAVSLRAAGRGPS